MQTLTRLAGVVSFILISLSMHSQSLTGTVTGNEALRLNVYAFYGRNLDVKESAEIKGGKVSFKGPFKPGFYKLGITQDNAVTFIMGKEKPTFTADLKDLAASFKVQNSLENELYARYLSENAVFSQKVNEINASIRSFAGKEGVSRTEVDQYVADQKMIFDSLSKQRKVVLDGIASKHQGTFIAGIIRYLDFDPSVSEQIFLEGFRTALPEICNGDMIFTRVSMYLQNYILGRVPDLMSASEKVLQYAPASVCARELTYQALIENIQPVDAKVCQQWIKRYHKEFPDQNVLQRYATVAALEPEVGDEAPDIVLSNVEGKSVKLSDLRGKTVLIDFWASWCGPCRRENPNVVRVYKQYKDKGFDIYSVSLDNSKEKWVQAIAHDALEWPSHVSDLKGWQSAGAALYQVRGIPATFLLDSKGIIIGKNLRGQALESKLEEVLGSKP